MTSKKAPPFSIKIAVIALIMASTLVYSFVKKKKIEALTSTDNYLILKTMPEFKFKKVFDPQSFVTQNNVFKDGTKAVFVHFWGTWCAPCEAELPEFIEFVEDYKDQNVKGILLAVQDDDIKIKKFMKRFGELPENIVIVHDKQGKSMINFGTVKVPETYLFSHKGKNLNKFVGPQDWTLSSYDKRMRFYLASIEDNSSTEYEIKSH